MHVKIKQSRYRPGVAQRVPGKLRFPDYMTTAQHGGKVTNACNCMEIYYNEFPVGI
jgi:hypothetical protein